MDNRVGPEREDHCWICSKRCGSRFCSPGCKEVWAKEVEWIKRAADEDAQKNKLGGKQTW
jgi:predicted nucleic acid-binding Zn ribbon protein